MGSTLGLSGNPNAFDHDPADLITSLVIDFKFFDQLTLFQTIRLLRLKRLPRMNYITRVKLSYAVIFAKYTESISIESAIQKFEKVASYSIKQYGEKHPLVGLIYQNLAYLYYIRGNLQYSLRLLESSLFIEVNWYKNEFKTIPMIQKNIEYIKELIDKK